MRWLIAHLYGVRDTGRTDPLGVPETERADLGEAMVRSVPMAESLRHPDGENPYRENERAFATPIPLKRAQAASVAVVEGIAYDVTGAADTGRMRLITARRSGE